MKTEQESIEEWRDNVYDIAFYIEEEKWDSIDTRMRNTTTSTLGEHSLIGIPRATCCVKEYIPYWNEFYQKCFDELIARGKDTSRLVIFKQ